MCTEGNERPGAQVVRLPRPDPPSRVFPPLVAGLHSSAPPAPPSPPRGAPTSRQLERRDVQPSRPARQGHSVVTSSGAGLASFPGKTTRTAYLRNLGAVQYFPPMRITEKGSGAGDGGRTEGMGSWRKDRKRGGTSEREGEQLEGGRRGRSGFGTNLWGVESCWHRPSLNLVVRERVGMLCST